MKKYFKIALSILCLSWALNAKAAAKDGLDVNDVSFIFPLDAQRKPYPQLRLDSGFIQPELFVDVLAQGQGDLNAPLAQRLAELRPRYLFQPHVITDIKNWYIVSFRYENCGDAFQLHGLVIKKTHEKCFARLRLVAQPLPQNGWPIDTALHLIYNIETSPADGRAPSIQGLLNLKAEAQKMGVNTSRKPLQPHPALLHELRAGQQKFAGKVVRFIDSQLGPQPVLKLKMLTLIATVGVSKWEFIGGVILQKQRLVWQGFNTPIFENLTSLQAQKLSCDASALCEVTPQVDSHFDLAIFPRIIEMFAFKSPDQYQPSPEFQTLAEIIDQPQKADLFNTDCISCHQTATQRNKNQLFVENLTPFGITPYTKPDYLEGDSTFVINFGYQGQWPRISIRTVEESALVADSVNQVLGMTNSGHHCEKSQMPGLWQCLNSDGSAAESESCYESHCRSATQLWSGF